MRDMPRRHCASWSTRFLLKQKPRQGSMSLKRTLRSQRGQA